MALIFSERKSLKLSAVFFTASTVFANYSGKSFASFFCLQHARFFGEPFLFLDDLEGLRYSLRCTVKRDELQMCGSSRLRIVRPERFLALSGQYGDTSGTISLLGTWRGRVFTRGNKFFELTNHLGNVLVTITDRKQQIAKNDSVISYYEPDVATANDYYPFGMLMPGRRFSAGTSYRYGFNGKENDNDVKGEGNQQDYGMRIYDPRVGRFLSIDPLQTKYPELTPY